MDINFDFKKSQSEFDKLLLLSTVPQIIVALAMIFMYHKNPIPANLAEVRRVANKIDRKPVQVLTQTFKYYWILLKNRNYWLMALSWVFLQGMNTVFYITTPKLLRKDLKMLKFFKISP